MTDVSATTNPLPVDGGGSRRPRPEVVVVIVVVLLVLVALLLRATARQDDVDRSIGVDRGGRDRAVLSIDSGADRISVVTGDVDGDLLRATTPDGSRVRPLADVSGDEVRIRTADIGDDEDEDNNGPADITLTLARDVRWDVVVRGGSQQLTFDLTGTTVGRVEVAGGQGAIDAKLPRPDGLATFVVGGGAGQVRVNRPDGVPVRVDLRNGAGTVAIDDDQRQGLAGGSSVQSPTWSGAGDRLEVDATTGVGRLTVGRN